MQFLMLIHIDEDLVQALPDGEFDRLMRGCFEKADVLRAQGCLLGSQQLEPAHTARTLRTREGATRVIDGPFAETKEMLAGFNLIEAADLDEAVRIAGSFPWTRLGSIEVREVRDMGAVRERVGAMAGTEGMRERA